MSVPQLLVVSAFPIFVRAARDDSERLAYGVGRMFHAMLILGVGFALVLVLGAPFVIDVVAGPAFGPAAAGDADTGRDPALRLPRRSPQLCAAEPARSTARC